MCFKITLKNEFFILLFFVLFSLLNSSILAQEPNEQLSVALENPGHTDKPVWFKNSFLDLAEDIEESSEANKKLMLYFYQDGCPYCKKLLQDNFGNHDIAKYTQENYDVIALNLWGDKELVDLSGKSMTEKQFAEQYKVMFTPSLLFLDQKNNKQFRINGYYHPQKFLAAMKYFVSNKQEGKSFRQYYAKNKQPKGSGKLHSGVSTILAPYNLSLAKRSANKPLLVMFEQKQCTSCDELHGDILRRPKSLQLLKKFDVLVLDQWSNETIITPAGKSMQITAWANQLNIQTVPSFIFFDQNNQQVFRAEAYLKAFHTQGVMDYVASGGYLKQPNFQRWLGAKADALEAKGVHVDLWK